MADLREIVFSENRVYTISSAPFYEGQFSKLYDAIDQKFKRNVIVKEVSADRKEIENLKTEVVTCCKISNFTNQVPFILDFKQENNCFWIVMQKISGKDLSQILREGNLNQQESMRYAQDLCKLVGLLHKNRYEHRDLKPDNIRIGKDGRVYLLDFNISSLARKRGTGSDFYRAPENDLNYTIKGNYRMDVFSIGVILYQMFTNHLPVPFKDYGASSDAKEWAFFKEPKEYRKDLSPKVNDIIVRCMKMSPLDRYENANQIAYALLPKRSNHRR